MKLDQDAVLVILFAAIAGGFFYNHSAAFAAWCRQAIAKLAGWTEAEAKVVSTEASTEFATLKADLVKLVQDAEGKTAAVPASSPVNVTVTHAPVNVSVAAPTTVPTTVPTTAPAGTIPAAPAETYNGVAVPEGLTLTTFTQLGTAIQGVQAMLTNPALHAALVSSTAAWWAGLGPFFREEFGYLSTGDILTAMLELNAAPGAPPLLTITPDQQGAALRAVAAVAPTSA